MTTQRGCSNRNDRGSVEDRRRRKAFLLEVYAADVQLDGQPACRCYRCGCLLTAATITVDRIKPKAHGGTYRRDNIRPACDPCNVKRGSPKWPAS